MTQEDWQSLANQVVKLEETGMHISSEWYEFGPVSQSDVEKLLQIQEESHQTLQQLSNALDRALKEDAPGSRVDAQYAYELTQELIQSRVANREMLQNLVTQPGKKHPEFARALALKERAAALQANKLQERITALQQLHQKSLEHDGQVH